MVIQENSHSGLLYFEDIFKGLRLVSPPYRVCEEEIISFAKKWDPQPFHIDRARAAHSEFGRLIACGMHVNCIRGLLYHRLSPKPLMAAGLGANKTKLLNPVEPDDELVLSVSFIDFRLSASRPHLGVVTAQHELRNQTGTLVMELEAVTMIPLRKK